MENRKIWWKTLLKVAMWFIGIWAILLAVLQVTLSERILTKVVNKYAAEYIDGELSFGSASVSMFKHFPRVFITLEDFHITYPSDRFDAAEQMGAQGHLVQAGCGELADTLASFNRFSASINIASLAKGTLKIPHLRLVHPRIFAHSYANGESNLSVLKFFLEDEQDSSAPLPLPEHLSVGRISFSRHPHIVYTNSKDSIFAMIDVARIGFIGQISTKTMSPRGNQPKFTPRNNTKGLTLDSLIVAGRVKQDTISFALDRFYIQDKEGFMGIDAEAKATLATRAYGRIYMPITMSGRLDFPKDNVPAIELKDFRADFGDLPIIADAEVKLMSEKARIKTRIGVQECKLNDIFHGFAKNIIPALEHLETDATLTMLAECEGDYLYKTGGLPPVSAFISIPESRIYYSELDSLGLRFEVSANGHTDSTGRMNGTLEKAYITGNGLQVSIIGEATDLLGKDPSFGIDGNVYASLDTLASVLPDTLGVTATGEIVGHISGKALMSQLSIYNFSRADITGCLNSEQFIIQKTSDTLNIDIKGMEVSIGPEERVSQRDSTKVLRLAGITAKVKQGTIDSGDSFHAQTKELLLSAKNSVSADVSSDPSSRVNPLSGRLNASILSLRDADGITVSLSETKNSFILRPKKEKPEIPVLNLRSSNNQMTVSQGNNTAILNEANLKAIAEMNNLDRQPRRLDSLQRQALIQRARESEPEWMKDEDFRKQDIDIRLDETLAKYFREWNLDGEINVTKGHVVSSSLPLSNSLRGLKVNFNNDEIKVDSFKVVYGKSEMEAKGALSGLRRAMLGRSNRSRMKLNLDVYSGKMNADELLAAYQSGANDSTSSSSLLVIPANLEANINISARNASYADLLANKISASILMKERCVQIKDAKAYTNMGEMALNAFYSTKTKKDLSAGFDLKFKDITADKAITLMPAIDTLIPLLSSFSGNLNCDVTATAALDTNMHLVIPSVNGIVRVSGKNLLIKENEVYRSMAKKFKFKNKTEGHIEDMTMEAVIQDNTLEIFPFIVSLDRYMLAVTGVQNMDMSYKYHASVIKSPLPVKLGVDIYGKDFDHMKFKVGKAKYKNSEVPNFSHVVDQAGIDLQKSILNVFDKGVDATIDESVRQSAILDHKQRIGYVNAVDIKLEELSGKEQKQMEDAGESTIISE